LLAVSSVALALGAETARLELDVVPKVREVYASYRYDRCMADCEAVCLATCRMTDAEVCDCEPLCKKQCFKYLKELQ
jgi:hypothetical protein